MRLSKRATQNWATSSRVATPDPRPMSTDEFRSICQRLQINDNVTAAELFGLSWRSCQRYHYGELDIPGPLARFLRLAARHKLSHDEMRDL